MMCLPTNGSGCFNVHVLSSQMYAPRCVHGQELSHFRGQIEPPASLPRGATVVCFGEVMSEEW